MKPQNESDAHVVHQLTVAAVFVVCSSKHRKRSKRQRLITGQVTVMRILLLMDVSQP